MKVLSGLLFAPTLAAVLLLVSTPSNAAHRGGGSAYDGTWSVAIYTQRGDCGSVRVAARIVGGRVYSKDESYQANGAVGANGMIRVSVAAVAYPHPAPADYRTIPAQDDGGRREENAPALGQLRDAQGRVSGLAHVFGLLSLAPHSDIQIIGANV